MKKAIGLLLCLFLMFCLTLALADAGNEITQAMSIQINTSYTDNIEVSDDVDFFKFTLPADGPVSISFSHDYENDSNNKWRIRLMDSNQETMLLRDFSPSTLQEVTTVSVGLPAGTFYVKIAKYDHSYTPCTLPYHVRVNYSASDAWEREINDNIATQSNPILLNKDYSGGLASKEDEDYYKFTLDTDGPVELTFGHDYEDTDSNRWDVSIRDKDNRVLFSRLFKPNQMNPITCATLGLPAGSYYVRIARYYYAGDYCDKKYTFRIAHEPSTVWETEPNDNVAYESDPIVAGTKYFGAITASEDTDYYVFNAAEAGTYQFTFTHRTLDSDKLKWTIQVLDHDLKEITSFSCKLNDPADVTKELELGTGNNYLVISRYYYQDYDESTYSFLLKVPAKKIDIGNNDVTVSTINTQVYTGSPITPSFTVKYQGQVLIFDTDYIYEFSDNTKVGTAKLTITGINNFTGARTSSFIINPKAVILSSLTAGSKQLKVKWTKGLDITGYEIQYSLKKSFSGAKKVNISKAGTTSTTLKKLKAKKTYYVRIRAYKKVGGKKYYSDWSKILKKKTKK